MRRAVLLYNPVAGRRDASRRLGTVIAALATAGLEIEPRPTGGPGGATRLAREAAAAGAEAVIAFGGDGTVREAAAGLVGAATALAILAGGTTNVLAHALGIPADLPAAAALCASGRAHAVDVGLCAGQPFLMMASSGLDAFVLRQLDPRLKHHLGRSGILLQGLRELGRYGYPDLELEADGEPLSAGFAAVANIPFYGGRFSLVPGARCDDRSLDLVTFSGRGWAATAGFALALARGRHLRRSDVTVRRVERVVLRGPAGAAVQIDGDPCGAEVPVEIALSPQPLRVVCPDDAPALAAC